MAFFVPQPPNTRFLTRKQRLETQFPQSVNALRLISASVNPIKFGENEEKVRDSYHFITEDHAKTFFRSYMRRHFGRAVSEDVVRRNVLDTINLANPRSDTDGSIDFRANEIINEITDRAAHEEPVLKFIVGPTGAGKTVFSKTLFTLGRKRFWRSRVITTRVEYSKFEKVNGDNKINDSGLFEFVRKCCFRDTVLFLLYSESISDADRERVGIAAPPSCKAVVERLFELKTTLVSNGYTEPYSSEVRHAAETVWMELSEKSRDQLLHHFAKDLSLRYVISFDGFDCVLIEDFLFGTQRSLPIEFISGLLKSIKTKVRKSSIFAAAIEAHFLVYLRDSSFERLKMEIGRGVGKTNSFPLLWIVPPRYENLVFNVAGILTRSRDPAVNLYETYADDVYSAFDRHVFRSMNLDASGYLNFLFGSNARRMNHHIAQSLLAALHRASTRSGTIFPERSSGVDTKTLWQTLVRSHSIADLPRYVVLEDLFLHETRQLYPRLQVNPNQVSSFLRSGDVVAAIMSTRDRDETGGIFGCMFNYLVPFSVTDGVESRPALDALIRIVQFVRLSPKCNGAEVVEFMGKIGFECTPEIVHYLIYVLLRTEMLRYDGSSGSNSIDDVPLFVTTRGEIALDAVLLSITYLSESMLVSLHSDREKTKHLLVRDEDSTMWAIDSVLNASIAVHWIKEIEEIERRQARAANVDFDKYLLGSRLEADLASEANSILRSAGSGGSRSQRRLSDIEEKADYISRDFPGFKLLGRTR